MSGIESMVRPTCGFEWETLPATIDGRIPLTDQMVKHRCYLEPNVSVDSSAHWGLHECIDCTESTSIDVYDPEPQDVQS